MEPSGERSANRTAAEQVLRLFRQRGDSQYGGEAVSQREHALQAAMFAEQAGAEPSLIAAALLHDVGHLLHVLADDAPDHGIDDRHEALAAAWLQQRFGPPVVEPVRLHVAAKRYLCAVDREYAAQLSPPSVQSLALQGGPMTPEEVTAFEAGPFFAAAVRLRRWDEAAKVVDLPTPDLEHFCSYLAALGREKPACP
ncbi:MAG TPA: HD domain-containing protein [Pirellulales bacterium]|jgi:phosphonate degradation associated HDIG domain protein|nr:HD domain-containing protein [Pirellulales bacterium]